MYSPENVISGTFGELWIDDYYLAEVIGLEAKADFEKEPVNQAGTLAKGYKLTGLDCKGTLKFNKVTSYFLNLLDDVKKGKMPTCTIISKLADPAALGAERVKLMGVTFDGMSLANWEVKKLQEESISFTFTDWALMDTIAAQ